MASGILRVRAGEGLLASSLVGLGKGEVGVGEGHGLLAYDCGLLGIGRSLLANDRGPLSQRPQVF